MPSQFFGLTIAGSGINAYQTAINTTANNIANVTTEGYSRQVTNSRASDPLRVNARYGSTGTGITTDSIKQLRNLYYDEKYWQNENNLGLHETKLYYMQQIEEFFTDDDLTTGFVTLMNKYQSALDNVKDSDGSETSRQTFISSAQSLGVYFNHVSAELSSMQSGINDQIKTTVDNVNAIAEKMALLTKQINVIEIQGGYANELRDQRALLADELNAIVPVEISEAKVLNTNDPNVYLGGTTYTVKLLGQLLVDTYDYRQLECVARDLPANQSDASGLFDLRWKDTGVSFNAAGEGMSGSLRALFDMRDGNNNSNFYGYLSSVVNGKDADGNAVTKAIFDKSMNADAFSGENGSGMSTVQNMNMPSHGYITINNVKYEYDGFDYETQLQTEKLDDGTTQVKEVVTSYSFNLVNTDQDLVSKYVGKYCKVGESVDCMGVPYYMNQLSGFLRSFTQKFNDIEESGVDMDGNAMGAFFVAENALDADGSDYDFDSYSDAVKNFLKVQKAVDADETGQLKKAISEYQEISAKLKGDITFEEEAELERQRNDAILVLTDTTLTGGAKVYDPDTKRLYSETSYSLGGSKSGDSYYYLTASNFKVSDDSVKNPRRFSTASSIIDGVEKGDLTDRLKNLYDGVEIVRGCKAKDFLQCMYDDVAVDCEETKVFTDNYTSIKNTIQTQRESVSGVDKDEEALDLIKFQNAYNLNSKVIQVLTEIYDRLILETGV